MEYKKIKLDNYNLHLIKTDKFKYIEVRIAFRRPIKKEDITFMNFLSDVMSSASSKFKTKRELIIEKQNLYGNTIGASTYRLGNYLVTNFVSTLLEEKYTEEGMLEKSLDLFSEILFHPNVCNNKFDSKIFNVVLESVKNEIKSIKEDPRKYSLIKMLEKMGPDEVYAYHGFGYEEDLAKINEENLYQFYKYFITNSVVNVYVIGNIDCDDMQRLIENKFKFKSVMYNLSPFLKVPQVSNEVKIYTEKDDKLQSKLSIGCKILELSDYEKRYVLTLYNIILGATADSKLFVHVREEKSLAYYINSTVNKLDNLLLISSGINKKDFKDVVDLVKIELENMEKGNFSMEDVDKAKKYYESVVNEAMDSAYQIIELYSAMELLNYDDIETRLKMIKKVTKEDIMAVSKKIKLDTVYLLEGCDET